MNYNRVIKFEKVCNFRDVGGLQTEDGRTMKRGVLFRSDELSQLSANDGQTIRQLNLKLICDLRTPLERKGKLDRIPNNNGIRQINIPIYPHREDFTQQKFIHLLNHKSNGDGLESLIKEYYHRFAFEQTDQLKEVLTLIANENNLPALIHCSVGKDRTGFISALIQLLAGVSRFLVMEDYLISNRFIEERTKKMIRFIRLISFFRISAERLKPMLETRSEYLDEILDEIFETYGTVEEYLKKRCRLDSASIERLRNLILG